MEGTSGAAEHALLRGRACEAALSCEGPRQRAPGRAGARAPGQRGGFVQGAKRLPTTPNVSGRRIVTSLRQEVSEPIGLGRSFHRERSRWKEPSTRPKRSSEWPLTRETSTGRPTKVGRPSAARRIAERRARARGESFEHEKPGAKLHQRATANVVLRSSGGRGRARGSNRLQKSTGGARPFSPTCEERVDNEARSSFAARERGEVKKRRKPARPWQSGEYGGGLSTYRKWGARKRSPGSICRWKASWVVRSRPR
jgi:hypothetical protein